MTSEALAHTAQLASYDVPASYERLEYVGDALLSLVVAQHDLVAHPFAEEGQLR